MRFLFLIFFCVLLNEFSTGQPSSVSFEHYTNENGLSADQIAGITQDKFGFIWIATSDGLNRFDGRSFTIYRHDSNDSTTLCDNIVNAISADSSGNIWVATNGGLCYYHPSDDHFHTINIRNDNQEAVDRTHVLDVIAGRNKTVWFITRTQLHAVYEDGSMQSFSLPAGSPEMPLSLFEDKANHILLGTNKSSVLVFDERSLQFTPIQLPNNPNNKNGKSEIDVVKFFQDGKDSVWIGSWVGGFQLLTFSKPSEQTFFFTDQQESSVGKWIVLGIEKSNLPSQLWIGTYGSGLSLFDEKSGKFIRHIHHDPSDAKSLCNDYVNTLFMDQSGTLWVGTNQGLDKHDPLMHQFSFLKIPELNQSVSIRRQPDAIVDHAADPTHQTIWIAVPGAGLFLYNAADEEFKLFHHIEGDPYSLPTDNITTLYNDATGTLWIGTHTGVCTYDEKKKDFRPVSFSSSSPPTSISGILEDSQHRMWLSSFSNGVYCYSPSSKKLIAYYHDEKNPRSLPDDHVFCICEDHNKRIWAGTQNKGLCLLDESRGEWKIFSHEPGNKNSLPENGVYDLLEDQQHQLWIATENGLAVMNLKTEEMRVFTTTDGLCNNDVFTFQFDQQHHLWLATNNGLSDFDPGKGTFRNYHTTNGLQTNHIGGAFSVTRNGTMYIGDPGGISYFNPATLKINQQAPQVIITTFKIFDRPVNVIRHGMQLQPVHLSYKQNMITFNFAGLNFTNAGNNRYAYKLEGFDHDWIDCGNRNSATYTNLNGGDYVFRVKAANNDGVWNEEGASVSLQITPPFWKTWWFYLLVTFTIVLSLFVIYRIRINQILRLHGIRQRIARDLHDDIGSTLSSITMMTRPKISLDEYEKPKELLQTINKASQQAMDLMSDIVWSVNPVNDHLENVIIRMREYAGEILDASNIDFVMEFDPALQSLQLPMNKRKDFFLFYKEAVNNLAKYSKATKAIIRLSYHHHQLTLSVSDNGIGFDTEKKFSGNGLKNIKARAALLNGKLSVTSNHNEGTVVWLSFHLSHDDGIAGRKPKK